MTRNQEFNIFDGNVILNFFKLKYHIQIVNKSSKALPHSTSMGTVVDRTYKSLDGDNLEHRVANH